MVVVAGLTTVVRQRAQIRTLSETCAQRMDEIGSLMVQSGVVQQQLAELWERELLERAKAIGLETNYHQAITKAQRERQPGSTGVETWVDEQDFVDVPRSALPALRVSGYALDEHGNLSVSPEALTMLGLSRQEYAEVQQAMTEARERHLRRDRELIQISDQHPKLAGNNPSRVTYRLAPYAMERAIRGGLSQRTRGSNRSSTHLFAASVRRAQPGEGSSDYREFTRLGRRERTLTLGWRSDGQAGLRIEMFEREQDSYLVGGDCAVGETPHIPSGWQHLIGPETFNPPASLRQK